MRSARVLAIALLASAVHAQEPKKLTLKEAEQTALRDHPAIRSAEFTARAAQQVTLETRSAAMPLVAGNVTTAGAADRSRIAAGALNNPIIYNRLASGFSVGQLITDFGRTASLTETARLRAEAFEIGRASCRERV